MKRKITITISILLFSYVVIFSQISNPKRPYEPLTFPNLTPIWYQINYDSTMISDSSDGYNYFNIPTDVPDIIDGDYLYSAYYKFGKREAFTGTYITKRNINTGELIWRVRYGYPDDPRQEIVRLMYLNEDGNIETINQVKKDPYLTNKWLFQYDFFVHSKRIFDNNNGSLLNHDVVDYNDSEAYYTSFNYFSRSGIFFKEGDSIRYFTIRKDPRLDTFAFHYYGGLINYNSKANNVKEKMLQSTYYTSSMTDYTQTNPARINDDIYLFVEYYDDHPVDGLYFRYTDKNMNIKEEYLSDQDLGYATGLFQLNRISEDQNRFLFFNSLPPDDPNASNNKTDILILDREAKLLNKVEISHNYPIFEILEWYDDNALKILAVRSYGSRETNDYRISLDLLNVNSDGIISIEKNFVNEDSLRYLTNIICRKIDRNRFLLKLREGSQAIENGRIVNDIGAKAFSYMMIDGSEFNIGTSTQEIIPELNAYLYPNPGHDELNIDFLETFSGKYDIISATGAKMNSGIISNETRSKIDISMLPKGMYSIVLKSKDSRKLLLSLKFVKV